mgnify:FL=1
MIADYCGARGPLTLDDAAQLGSGWAYQPKIDGCYARIETSGSGRVIRAITRSGQPLRCGLEGLATGMPAAVLHAEVEAHTEAGIRAAATAGFTRAHLFDVTALDGRDLRSEPYADRYAALHTYQVQAELRRVDPWRRDRQGDHHDTAGRYCVPIPVDYRRFPIVPQHRGPNAARELWRDHVERHGGEGIVAVALRAPVGRRNAKRKIKPRDTLDARVVSVDSSAAVLIYAGHQFVVSARGVPVHVGEIVEVAHSGWYESGVTPRFARIVRVRHDLMRGTVH